KKLKELRRKSELIIYKDAHHGFTFKGLSPGNGLVYDKEITEKSLNDIEKFVFSNLRETVR
ncbi:MAG: hypothetical protein GX640_02655, partial [Fibrobacter sp.]|nr:hypothetical protein [Fibrobacter sp.]